FMHPLAQTLLIEKLEIWIVDQEPSAVFVEPVAANGPVLRHLFICPHLGCVPADQLASNPVGELCVLSGLGSRKNHRERYVESVAVRFLEQTIVAVRHPVAPTPGRPR